VATDGGVKNNSIEGEWSCIFLLPAPVMVRENPPSLTRCRETTTSVSKIWRPCHCGAVTNARIKSCVAVCSAGGNTWSSKTNTLCAGEGVCPDPSKWAMVAWESGKEWM